MLKKISNRCYFQWYLGRTPLQLLDKSSWTKFPVTFHLCYSRVRLLYLHLLLKHD